MKRCDEIENVLKEMRKELDSKEAVSTIYQISTFE